MDKWLKKLSISIIIIFILVCSINNRVYAADINDAINNIVNLMGGFIGFLLWPYRLLAIAIGALGQILATAIAKINATDGSGLFVTAEDIFFNRLPLVDVNFFDFSVSEPIKTIREQVAKWYVTMRLISTAILLLVLIYVGIKMAISTVASEKALYKKMLVDWVASIALIYLLHYIILAIVSINSTLVKFIENALGQSGASSINNAMITFAVEAASPVSGLSGIASTIVYCMMVFQTISFLIMYIKRMLTIGFLIIIAPLITITYAIDKMGDGKSQVLDAWLKEFAYNILIQPFHCILYVAFVNVAIDLITNGSVLGSITGLTAFTGYDQLSASILAVLCIKFVGDGEKIIRKIFGFEKAGSLASAAASAAIVTAGISKAKDMGASARKGVNFMKENNAFKSMQKDMSKLKSKHLENKNKRAEKKETKKLMKGGMSKESAEAQAKQNVMLKNAEKGEKLRKKGKISISKEDAKGMHDRAHEKYQEALQSGRNMGGRKYKDYLEDERKAFLASKVRNGDYQKGVGTKAISKAKGAVRKVGNKIKSSAVVKSITGSETFKYYTDPKRIAAGIGFGLGAMSYGAESSNLFTSIGLGMGAKNGAEQFLSTSTSNISRRADDYFSSYENIVGRELKSEESTQVLRTIDNNSQSGLYDSSTQKGKEHLSRLLQDVKNALIAINANPDRSNSILGQLRKELSNPKTVRDFDMNSFLNSIPEFANATGTQKDNLGDSIMEYGKYVAESNVANELNNATGVGTTTDSVIEKISNRREISNNVRTTYNEEIDYSTLDMSNIDTYVRGYSSILNQSASDIENLDISTLKSQLVKIEDLIEGLDNNGNTNGPLYSNSVFIRNIYTSELQNRGLNNPNNQNPNNPNP